MNIKTISFGCRLNALESEKIEKMLSSVVDTAIVVNTCSVTGEAERQSAQMVRKISRENPDVVIFVTGCGSTRNEKLFSSVKHVIVIPNEKKLNLDAYIEALKTANFCIACPKIDNFSQKETKLSKQFIQIQNGCNHDCTYCVTRLLRGANISFPYEEILANAREAINKGFYEIILTGVDTASYVRNINGKPFLLADVCRSLLKDVPEIKHLRLSSIDPASPEVPKIIDLMNKDARFMPHLHLSMQSGCDVILRAMRRRHTADSLRNLIKLSDGKVSFSADIICGFPNETDELFAETAQLVKDLGLIHVHAFPYSPRPNTVAATMPNQINRSVSKQRVKIIDNIAKENLAIFMQKQIGKTVSVLVEENNIGRTPDDIEIKILGDKIAEKTICDVKIDAIEDNHFNGTVIK